MMNDRLIIRHLIFDLDGTLVDSALDFDQMRHELGFAAGAPILETLTNLPPHEARRGWEIVERHELAGAERATPFPGVLEFLRTLAECGVRQAVLTRNSRRVAEAMLQRLPFAFDLIATREDAPIKPDPGSIWRICDHWGVAASQAAMIGDSWFDMETGRRAGAYNVLFARGRDVSRLEYACSANHVLQSYQEPTAFWEWLRQPT